MMGSNNKRVAALLMVRARSVGTNVSRSGVKKDNTFRFQGRRYETPADLRDKEIQLRYDRHRSDTLAEEEPPTGSPSTPSCLPPVIYHKGQRIGPAQLLDTIANGLLRRERRKEQS